MKTTKNKTKGPGKAIKKPASAKKGRMRARINGSAHHLMERASNFLHMEAAGGIMLVAAAIVAIIVANSPLFPAYDYILNSLKITIGFGDAEQSFGFEIKKALLLWINDGLMAIFFFMVGLEIKREVMEGELSSRARALLPALAALGGVILPAIIFWQVNQGAPRNLDGWAIPAATDIAFALGVLGLLGSRAPVALKILLTAIAVIDDLAAILIIAVFYSKEIFAEPLYVAGAALLCLFLLNTKNVRSLVPYILLAVILWVAVLKSGIHATLAGVVAALFIPAHSPDDPEKSPCRELEHALHPWVAFAILPLFAFANAGVPFDGMGPNALFDPLTLGIILGLVVGKPAGIFSVLFLTIKSGLSPMPKDTNWLQLFALSVLCGIGFTMSLFVGGLAFSSLEMQAAIRLGVLTASTIAAALGFVILYFGCRTAKC